MPIIAKQTGSDFIPCPAGLHHAVCVDVIDLGKIKVSYGGKEPKEQHKIRLIWQTDEPIPETGKPYIVQKRYTLSLGEKATLRKDLESWRSKPLSAEELAGFDVEVLIGVNCQISVMHDTRDGSTYANVTSVVPPPKGTYKIGPRDYVRVKDRTDGGQRDEGYQASDEDIPF